MDVVVPTQADVKTIRQGREKQPVVVIDSFFESPDDLVEDAEFLHFSRFGEHYPGVRARVPEQILSGMVERVERAAADVFGVRALSVIDAFYSLVTTRPEALNPIQRMPHFDGVEHERLALLHYLVRDDRGGTAFYRHRSTGFESVDAERLPSYRQALEQDLANGFPGPGYIAGDTDLFEEIAVHRGIFNRAILYRSNTLHCARLPTDTLFTPDPGSGRLTINIFLTGDRIG